jgi:hypothetical protein
LRHWGCGIARNEEHGHLLTFPRLAEFRRLDPDDRLLLPVFRKEDAERLDEIFNTEFMLDYWGKFWLTWSIGLGIFFGLVINIYAAKLNYVEAKEFLIRFDVVAYIFAMGLSLSQLKRNEPVWEFM